MGNSIIVGYRCLDIIETVEDDTNQCIIRVSLDTKEKMFITINEMPRSDQMSVFIQNCQSPITESDKGIIEKILDTINGYTSETAKLIAVFLIK